MDNKAKMIIPIMMIIISSYDILVPLESRNHFKSLIFKENISIIIL